MSLIRRVLCSSTLRRTLAAAIVLAALGSVIVSTWHIYSRDGRASSLISYTDPNTDGESLHIRASVLDVDFSDKSYKVHCTIKPNGTLADDYGQLNQPVMVSFSSTQALRFNPGDVDNPVDVSYSYETGNDIEYPFDEYVGRFEVYATHADMPNQTIPVSIELEASILSYTFRPTLESTPRPHHDRIILRIQTNRSPTTVGFTLFICVLMWALSLVMSIFSYQVAMRKRHVNAHTCMIGITMLFALPALRSAQPGAPDIGCTSDILSFYWSMAIIATDSLAILVCWISRWQPPSACTVEPMYKERESHEGYRPSSFRDKCCCNREVNNQHQKTLRTASVHGDAKPVDNSSALTCVVIDHVHDVSSIHEAGAPHR
ncbi:hypothetical protein BCR43DRAFT_475485 [Syncephalastrum racemosum]|uniref:Uncharacterized protein n=1 Tax=Syncephalastrum racemosum TaxID=13706 RepID=A0A1X2HAA4_SYNRA|nr:hypothetical protein BCR43DRAFT_475485 [Syncephalastrum racemosum]